MINRKKMSRILLMVIAGCLTLSQAGCRNSPVLVQTVYEQDHEMDEDTQTESIDNDEENEDQDEDLAPHEQLDDSDSKRDQSREDALNGDGTDTANQTYRSVYDEYADTTGTASDGSSDSGSGEENDTDSGNGSDNNIGSGEDNESDSGGNGSLDDGSDSGTDVEATTEKEKKQIVDARGEYVEVPVDVDTVTAVGEAAVIVEMLGGSGRLLASSGSFTGNSLVQSAFSSQGISDVMTWWDGDGSGTITAANFDALVAAKPDVCFEISGQSTFSSDQIAALEAAGISYVVIHSFTSVSNIEAAVTLVAEVLGDKSSGGGTNAPQIAQQYCSWADDTVSSVQGRGSAKTTLYISAWDESAYWEIKNSTSGMWGGSDVGSGSGYGVAIAWKGASTASLNESMGIANLTNRALDNYYAVPFVNSFWLHYVTGGTGKTGTNSGQIQTVLTRTTAGVSLGESDFPAIVVADSSIKSAIENDFHWDVYGTFTNNSTYANSFNDGNGNPITSSIVGDYEIYVNPTGLASWTGGIEAPLEAAWLSYKFQSGDGGCSLNEVRSLVSDFYSTFYNINVDTSSILGE